ncbi:Hypothetical protein PHPALM_10673, partial [Phytophthora palmivora]
LQSPKTSVFTTLRRSIWPNFHRSRPRFSPCLSARTTQLSTPRTTKSLSDSRLCSIRTHWYLRVLAPVLLLVPLESYVMFSLFSTRLMARMFTS